MKKLVRLGLKCAELESLRFDLGELMQEDKSGRASRRIGSDILIGIELQIRRSGHGREVIASALGIVREAVKAVRDGVMPDYVNAKPLCPRKSVPRKRKRPAGAMDEQALWIWGRMRDFERDGLIIPADVLAGMTDTMREDVKRIAPIVVEWLSRMEGCL